MPGTYNHPWGATVFQATGNYGSTVHDPVTNRVILEINICDECLVANKDLVIDVRTRRQDPVYDVKPWDPQDLTVI